jgi:hypothetical protein
MMLFFKGSELYCKYDGSNNWTDYLEPIEGITVATDQWNRISYAYNDGVLRVYFNNVLVMSKDGFEDALGAAYCHFIQRNTPVTGTKYSSWADFARKNSSKVKM